MISAFELPPSQGHHVKVSMMNGAISRMRSDMLVTPQIKGHEINRMATYSFLVESEHRSQKILFDLAFMKDVNDRMPPALKAIFSGSDDDDSVGIDETYDIPSTLQNHGIELESINAIIWSHSHLDHMGDPSVFPPSTALYVGPGFKSDRMPGYPTNPSAFTLDSAFSGRQVHEVAFSSSVGGFQAFDYFQDGSLYILNGGGHTTHHLCALARTTDDSFVLLAADACHHAGSLRPSAYLPLPDDIPSAILPAVAAQGSGCSCSQFHSLLPSDTGSAFYGLARGMHEDFDQAMETIRKLQILDARDDVFIIIAHDYSLLDVVDFFPKTLNAWRERGWAEAARWRFLDDFKDAIDQ